MCFFSVVLYYIFKEKWLYQLVVAILFLLLGPGNVGESSVAMDLSYIFEKLKILYVFSLTRFLQELLVSIFCLLVLGLKRKKLIDAFCTYNCTSLLYFI